MGVVMQGVELGMDWTLRLIGPVLVSPLCVLSVLNVKP